MTPFYTCTVNTLQNIDVNPPLRQDGIHGTVPMSPFRRDDGHHFTAASTHYETTHDAIAFVMMTCTIQRGALILRRGSHSWRAAVREVFACVCEVPATKSHGKGACASGHGDKYIRVRDAS